MFSYSEIARKFSNAETKTEGIIYSAIAPYAILN
jgi:hypothetical protein